MGELNGEYSPCFVSWVCRGDGGGKDWDGDEEGSLVATACSCCCSVLGPSSPLASPSFCGLSSVLLFFLYSCLEASSSSSILV